MSRSVPSEFGPLHFSGFRLSRHAIAAQETVLQEPRAQGSEGYGRGVLLRDDQRSIPHLRVSNLRVHFQPCARTTDPREKSFTWYRTRSIRTRAHVYRIRAMRYGFLTMHLAPSTADFSTFFFFILFYPKMSLSPRFSVDPRSFFVYVKYSRLIFPFLF